MACERCERSLPPGMAICPHCGARQLSPAERRRRTRSILLATALSAAILLLWHRLAGSPHPP